MTRAPFFVLSAAILCSFCVGASAQKTEKPTKSDSNAASSTSQEIRDGERVFQTNCGRCHNPPGDISPREARAVVRQMRVRAILSERDEQALLKFLAP